MMLQRRNKVGLMMLLCLIYLQGAAQSFRYQAMLDTVRQTGFYKIPITPELSAHLQTDFRDVRIWDAKGRQAPYIIRSLRPKWEAGLFMPFRMEENKLDDSGHSVIIVKKNVSYSIFNLSLIIRNASVSRYASLSGSNDGKHWFIISERLLINDGYEAGTDSSIQAIYFPFSAYPYFKLVIDNDKSDPLNISDIGYYSDPQYSDYDSYPVPVTEHYLPNPQPQIRQTDSSNGISYIQVIQLQAYLAGRLSLVIKGSKYYSRKVTVFLPQTDNKKRPYLNEIASFVVSSAADSSATVPLFKAKEFYLAIENGDNLPLQIQSVGTSQEYHELIAYLEAGTSYKLMLDAEDAAAPNYDLQQFSDSIPAIIPSIAVKEITQSTHQTIAADFKPFPHLYIWLIMIGIIALLGWLTWRLTAEMRKNV